MSKQAEVQEEVLNTISKLCKWINEKCDKGASGEEIRVLPEVITGVSELYSAIKN
ncbi:hypothetical protein LOZ80_25925 [Paenibacillus sp. HWE-109]|uniref:hypothetical protein n=1 Tax=Paenibacillus sp. HWE-109 TaxID=1306526 RepID=UPI001EDDB622|nr:hypothetical protein [Paenibacillus sp. HWE-109]UKS25019.1 hypothetical protein LOZ80_25925 [Paenibacillus sp. HWE-109]